MHAEMTGTVERDGVALAWRGRDGAGPGVAFLGGFASDMTGTKAAHLDSWCAARGRAFLRLDYAGHGASGGRFGDGTVGRWADDAAAVLAARMPGRRVLVGSSMGGWIALLLARRDPGALAGLVGIAAAPDFTETLLRPHLTPDQRAALARDGVAHLPNPYGPPTPVTAALLEDGRRHLVLPGPVALAAPVRLLHGMADAEVPWRTAPALAGAITGGDVAVTLVKDGDHRLSRPADLARLERALEEVLAA